jgi:hypothetical protein
MCRKFWVLSFHERNRCCSLPWEPAPARTTLQRVVANRSGLSCTSAIVLGFTGAHYLIYVIGRQAKSSRLERHGSASAMILRKSRAELSKNLDQPQTAPINTAGRVIFTSCRFKQKAQIISHRLRRSRSTFVNAAVCRYFNSSFNSANALTANSKSSRECAAETCVRHDRIEKADHVNSFLQHARSELL